MDDEQLWWSRRNEIISWFAVLFFTFKHFLDYISWIYEKNHTPKLLTILSKDLQKCVTYNQFSY